MALGLHSEVGRLRKVMAHRLGLVAEFLIGGITKADVQQDAWRRTEYSDGKTG